MEFLRLILSGVKTVSLTITFLCAISLWVGLCAGLTAPLRKYGLTRWFIVTLLIALLGAPFWVKALFIPF